MDEQRRRTSTRKNAVPGAPGVIAGQSASEAVRGQQAMLKRRLARIADEAGARTASLFVAGDPAGLLATTAPGNLVPGLRAVADAVVENFQTAGAPTVYSRAASRPDGPLAWLDETVLADAPSVALVPLRDDDQDVDDPCIGVLVLTAGNTAEPFKLGALPTAETTLGLLTTAVKLAVAYRRLEARHEEYRRRVHTLHEAGNQLICEAGLAVIVFGQSLGVQTANPLAERLYDLAPGAPLVPFLEGLSLEAKVEPWPDRLRQLAAGGDPWETEQVRARGHTVSGWLRIVGRTLHDRHGRPLAGMLIIEDTGSKQELEKRIEASERFAAVGRVAARVAHELNNPLDGILRYLNLASRQQESGGASEKVLGYMQEARNGLVRMAALVRQLSEFSRSTRSSLESMDVNRLLDQALHCMMGPSHERCVRVERRYADGLPAETPSGLFQVFCNLVKNALDAMGPDGGVLTVETELADDRQAVRIRDTGPGLPDVAEADLFRPFFTTKGPHAGTGLGLPISLEIVRGLAGNLTARNASSGGAVFTVDLPLRFD